MDSRSRALLLEDTWTAGTPDGCVHRLTDRKKMEDKLREQLKEIERLKNQLEQENIYLRDEIMLQHRHEEIVGRSAAMKKVLAQGRAGGRH